MLAAIGTCNFPKPFVSFSLNNPDNRRKITRNQLIFVIFHDNAIDQRDCGKCLYSIGIAHACAQDCSHCQSGGRSFQ